MFRDLSSQREFNPAGVQSIPISEMRDYLDLICEHRPQHRRLAMKLMLAMDSVFMEHVRKKQEQNRPSS